MDSKLVDTIPKFVSDYMEGAHPRIMQCLMETNLIKTEGYGEDEYCESAREKIRSACKNPEAEVHFLVGGTQTNATVIDAVLRSYQGVVAATSGHIAVHEAGAIEYGGHKVLQVPHENGKMKADDIEKCILSYHNDDSRDHMVMPGMVYISHPTEYGALYTKKELEMISAVCRRYDLPLYLDGARLGYALAAEGIDVTLETLAECCDIFYIGGTKCGALFGEAVVIKKPNLIPHFFSIMKQHGAVLAKGRLLGIQFDTLFTDNLYVEIARHAIRMAKRIKEGFIEKGYRLFMDSPSNQLFVILENDQMDRLSKFADFSCWEAYDESHSVVRFVTSWATEEADVENLLKAL
jgi:threonine aldolase